jgi:Protein of unknown function (DUF1501)
MTDTIRGSSGGLDRRSFLQYSSSAGLGLVLSPTLPVAIGNPKAKAVIQIFLSGGLTHLDTFDPKPYAPPEVRGEFKTIKSKADGEPFSEVMRRTAAIADKIAVIRSMTHGEAAHERGRHNMFTGWRPNPAILYPSMGSITAHELGGQNHLPPYVAIPNGNDEYMGTGYLSAAYAPFSLGDEPNRKGFQVRDLRLPGGVNSDRLKRRRKLLERLDKDFGKRAAADSLEATDAFYDQAYSLIESPKARAAFDLNKVPAALRNRYGRTNIGQRLLMARRLVEAGVRYVSVLDGGYDHHNNLAAGLRARMIPLDQGYAAMIADLHASGLLQETLVLLTTEFGRTPRYNATRGRDHWARAFSIVMAGGGIKGGVVHGSTAADGSVPEENPVGPSDLAATTFTLLGLDPKKRLFSAGGRPHRLVDDGKVLKDLIG